MTYEPPRYDTTKVFKQAIKTSLWGKPKSFNQCHKLEAYPEKAAHANATKSGIRPFSYQQE